MAKTKSGYGVVRIKNQSLYVHRLSLILHLGRPLGLDERALHHCDNPGCYEPTHLYAGSDSNNIQDTWDRGRISNREALSGENGPASKLTWSKVRDIRARVRQGEKQRSLAEEYKVSASTIGNIVHQKTWRE